MNATLLRPASVIPIAENPRTDRSPADVRTPPLSSEPTVSSRQWAILQQLFAGIEVYHQRSSWIRVTVRVVLAVATTKALLQGGAWLIAYPIAPRGAPLLPSVHALMFLGFLAPGFLMLVAGRRDRRAIYLGGFFLILATAFAREPGRRFASDVIGPLWAPLRLLLLQNLDAFLPLFLWLFAAEFPRTARPSASRRAISVVIAVAAVCGATLVALESAEHLMAPWPAGLRSLPAALGVIGRSNFYWAVTFGLTLAAFPLIFMRSRSVSGLERVRTTWFIASLVVGLGPVLLEVILESLAPRFEAWAQSASIRPILGTLLFSSCLTIPASSLYAVVFKRVLAVRVVLRRALQCVLAKYVLVGACVAPLITVAVRMYAHRDQTIVDVAADPVLRIALVLAGAGVLVLVFTERILSRIDALFFAPRYDARAILADLTPRLARAADAPALAELVRRAIIQTLGPLKTTLALVASHPVDATERSLQRLPADSTLVDVLTSLRTVDLHVSDRLLRAVSASDAAWLAQTGAHLLVPARASDGRLLAVLALAERGDEQPYGPEDHDLVAHMAAATALTLEQQRLRRKVRARTPGPRDVRDAAFECRACGRLTAARAPSICVHCGEPLELSYLPLHLHGKFRLERRLGQGGMGIVYRATDVMLRRPVALKTLPQTCAAAEHRLRAEARTMARLMHPNLAAIYGYEVWQGRSVLVVEYLEQGTLSAALQAATPSIGEVVTWVRDVCGGLQYLHDRQVLHGDIKPSNIGFDRHGIPKLLDFGLVGAFSQTDQLREGHDDADTTPRWGTRRYLCPDVATASPCPQFDLWSLALVMYEALAGTWPFGSRTIAPRVIPDIRTFRPSVPHELARVLTNALHLDMHRRPSSVLEFSLWLDQARPIG
jgi:GAF domain-containing protein